MRLVALALLLTVTAACDWRGYEHEQKVKAEHGRLVASQAAEEQDAFDKLCARDASACWDRLVRAAHRGALGPAPGMTGVSQVCCEVPATAVSQDHSSPSAFSVAVAAGMVTVSVAPPGTVTRGELNDTVRGLPAHVRVSTGDDQDESLSWTEDGTVYFAFSRHVSDTDTKAVLARLTKHAP